LKKQKLIRDSNNLEKDLFKLISISMDNFIPDKKAARVLDILDQVKKLNKMIDLHQNQSNDDMMVNQYQDMKDRFLLELKEILSDFQIEVLINKDKAA